MCHEMVHALRRMQGVFDPVPTRNENYKNEEEWLAVVIANIFISAKGGTALRADYYTQNKMLEKPLNTSAGFLSDAKNLRLLKKYYQHWKSVMVPLSAVTLAPFNPLQELVRPGAGYF